MATMQANVMISNRFIHRLALATALLASTNSAASPQDDYYDLGGFHYPTSTDSEAAQRWFDRGLAMCFGFNHEEAIRCFEQAAVNDPGMAMAYWGMAYAWGPNINNMAIPAEQMAKANLAIRLAELHADGCTDLERKLIRAVATRYAASVPDDRTPLNEAYADAFRGVYQDHGDDSLVAAMFVESLMNLQPWLHWSPTGEPGPHTPELIGVLDAALNRWPTHPALCHFYIHAMEASPTPAKALAAANALRNAMPGQGHLLHMPSHIDIWVGDYKAVIEANQKAIAADEEFLRREGPLNFYSYYRIHNYHFLVYGAMFDGQSRLALRTARKIKDQVPEEMLREQVDFLDAFMPTDLHVLVRFGQWSQILKEPEPAAYLPVSRTIWHYARGLAYAAVGKIDQAEAEQQSFEEALEQVPETSYLFQNPSVHILGVAESMLAGEIAYRRGDFDNAFDHLREAVQRDDALNYDEPWGWMQPTRHALGALLLEQDRLGEAESVYREDLRRHPNNPWALHGLAECLEKVGRVADAGKCRQQYAAAAQRADVKIDRSCFCKLSAALEAE